MTQQQAPEVTSELRECPFCGTGCSDDHNAVQVQPYVSHGEWSIICECCQAESGIYMSKAEAITAWNTRATQPLSLTVEDRTLGRAREALCHLVNAANGNPEYAEAAMQLRDVVSNALDRLQSLSLPVDIDRSGLAQEVDDISYAGAGT